MQLAIFFLQSNLTYILMPCPETLILACCTIERFFKRGSRRSSGLEKVNCSIQTTKWPVGRE